MSTPSRHSIVISSFDDLENPYYAGGGAIAIHEISRRLVKRFDITVVTGRYPKSVDKVVDGVKYIRSGSTVLGPKLSQIAFQLTLPQLAKTLRHDIWIESFTPPFSTSFMPIFTKKPVVGLVHMLSGADMKRKYHLPFDLVEKFGLQAYRRLIAVSAPLSDKLHRLNRRAEVTTIPNGVTRLCLSTPGLAGKTHFLFMGRIEVNQKGLDLLLSAYHKISTQTPFSLVIAGTGNASDLQELSTRINQLGLESRVKLVGKVTGQAKIRLIKSAVGIINTSRFETFSLVALEALVSGVPFVCFNIPGLKWLPSNCALKTSAFNVSGLAANLMRVSTQIRTRKQLIAKGLKFSANYSWAKSALSFSQYLSHITSI